MFFHGQDVLCSCVLVGKLLREKDVLEAYLFSGLESLEVVRRFFNPIGVHTQSSFKLLNGLAQRSLPSELGQLMEAKQKFKWFNMFIRLDDFLRNNAQCTADQFFKRMHILLEDIWGSNVPSRSEANSLVPFFLPVSAILLSSHEQYLTVRFFR